MGEFKSAELKEAKTVQYTEPRRVEPTGVLHFCLGVTDMEKSRRFYEDVVGCTYERQNETTVFMRAGDDHFVLGQSGYHQPPNKGRDTLIHHAFLIEGDDFDAALAHLEAEGVDVLLYEDTGHRSFSGRHAYFHDPDGNAIEFIDHHGPGDREAEAYQGRKWRLPKSHLEDGGRD